MSGTLAVYIIGSGYGESVVLRLPSGSVGVVDCFSQRQADPAGTTAEDWVAHNPTLRLLKRHLEAERLAFLALTHPHEDHGRGFSQLLHVYRGHIGQIWMFDGYELPALQDYFYALCRRRKSPIEEMLGERPGGFRNEIVRIQTAVKEQVVKGNTRFRYFRGYQEFQIPDESAVRFHFLGPTQDDANTYKSRIADDIRCAIDEQGTLDDDWSPEGINHNWISPALLIEFGQTRLLFGGDMEEPAWREVLKECDDGLEKRPPLGCQLVKASHHGSANGYTSDLYKRLCCGTEGPIGVVTPYNRNRSPLPSRDGLQHLLQSTSRLFTTSTLDVSVSTFEPTRENIPGTWSDRFAERPALEWILREELRSIDPPGEPPEEMPWQFGVDIKKRPELNRLLDPRYRMRKQRRRVREGADDDYCVMFEFDSDGRVVDEGAGRGAGEVDL